MFGFLCQFLLFHHLQCSGGYLASQRESAESGTVLTGPDGEHDRVVGQDSRDRKYTSGDSFPEDDDVGTDPFMITAELPPCTCNTGLHLIGNEQDVVLFTEFKAGS
ncbi:hypothetical protein SDC9_191324 [bioreactor metagenome]|uniref:Uncharacterized protein n=1 Tax=bioreactor metagenome TaxID=1076179 RepID=A0A645I5U0_9ZZZZ